MSFLCYLILVAFVGVVCMEVSHNGFHKHKTEVSSNKTGFNQDLNLVFEEESDACEVLHYSLLSHYTLAFNFSVKVAFSNFPTQFCTFNKGNILHKIPLFLSFRALRL